ncbi:MAG TPA: hypothetical protein VIE69_03950 [Methylophilaceae bacterium]
MKAILAALVVLFLPAVAFADGALPLDETNFVEAIKDLPKDKIVELLGQPTTVVEVKDNRTGELVGYAWDYDHLNTSASGDYYKTTELDVVGDRVVTIIFSNGRSDGDADGDSGPDMAPEENALPPGECNPSC